MTADHDCAYCDPDSHGAVVPAGAGAPAFYRCGWTPHDGYWLIDHLRDVAPALIDRIEQCPEGRLLYLQGELPDRLATRSALYRVHRRVLAEGQQPVASYYTALGEAGRRHHPVYEVAAAVPVPGFAPCSVCGQVRAVRGDGRMRKHTVEVPRERPQVGTRQELCAGEYPQEEAITP